MAKIHPDATEFSYSDWKIIKSRISAKKLAEKLGLNEGTLTEFETALENYEKNKSKKETNLTCSLRLALWLESIAKNTSIPFRMEFKENSTEETAIKQVRAIELIIRSLISEQTGGNDQIIAIMSKLFKDEIIEKWIRSSDETGILSGTTFSELSNLLLTKEIFPFVEDIFKNEHIEFSTKVRESIRLLLDDIRVIRNNVAHNKKLSQIQIEALNYHYRVITQLIADSPKSTIDTAKYLVDSADEVKEYLKNIQIENNSISGFVSDINEKSDAILQTTNRINRKTSIIIGISVLLVILSLGIYSMQDKLDKKSTKIANTTDNIDRNVNRVFDRFDKIEGAIKNSNPIANPKTANDYIVNAYIFKNAGEIEKSIEMFSKYLKKTKTVKFDIYNEYYQLLKLTFSQKYAEERTRSELNSEMISTVVFYNEIYGEDAIKEIAKLKISKTLKDFLFIVKSNEIKTNYISYLLYPFYLDVMHKRISLGKQFEKVYPFFFDTKGPLELLRLNNWGEIRGEIIMGHAGFQVAIKAHNSGMKELVNQEYEEWLLSAAKTSESTGGAGTSVGLNVSNTKAYIKYGTDVGLNRTFRSMP
jgi:plasmid maintenance system antidote protein VapI